MPSQLRKIAPRDSQNLESKLDPEVADYVADMTMSLARIARASQMSMLAYLLDLAALEADTYRSDDSGAREMGAGRSGDAVTAKMKEAAES